MDAFAHLKAISHTAEAQPLLNKANVKPDKAPSPPWHGLHQGCCDRHLGARAKGPHAGVGVDWEQVIPACVLQIPI